jgi:hypothetical protein
VGSVGGVSPPGANNHSVVFLIGWPEELSSYPGRFVTADRRLHRGELRSRADVVGLNPNARLLGRRLQFLVVQGFSRIVWVPKHGGARDARHCLSQQFQQFAAQVRENVGDPRDMAARPGKTRDEAAANGSLAATLPSRGSPESLRAELLHDLSSSLRRQAASGKPVACVGLVKSFCGKSGLSRCRQARALTLLPRASTKSYTGHAQRICAAIWRAFETSERLFPTQK